MPKLIEEDSRFNFYWGEGETNSFKLRGEKKDVREVLKELIAQYWDHHANMFGTEEPEMLICKYNIGLLQWALEAMRDGTKKDHTGKLIT